VVLGAASENARAAESQKLLNWGYTAFEAVRLFDAGQAVVAPPVWKGREAEVKLGLTRPIVVALPAGQLARMTTQVARPDPLVAPIARGQSIGQLQVLLDQKVYAEIPLVALGGVEQSGVLGRAWDAIRLWIK
jgi:D-alanyl-D-alanine carboxypeptidase (penicillin-binding protein 5/6)